MAKPDWFINGRFLTQKTSGVQRYAREIVRSLDALLEEGHPLARGRRLCLVTPPHADILPGLGMIEQRVVGSLRGHAWEQVSLPRYARGGLLNLCNTAPLLGRRNIVCIHDTNVADYPESYSRQFRLLYRALVPPVARGAAMVATVSAYSAGRIARFGLDRGAIAVLPNGHEHVARWRAVASPAIAAAAGPNTIVVLGSRAPHKNLGMLLGLAGALAGQGFRIAIAGAADAHVFQGAAAGEAGNVVSVGRISDDELAALLQGAHCLAFPSFVEGFGLPPLEAFAIGCPVVSSDRASLPEVCGEAALYAAPDRPDQWLSAFCALRDDPRLRAALIERGHARARAFSWRESALGYLGAMAHLDEA
ncbi:MAG: glycosyltransferase family 4 protein [Rhizobiales bacterium]|nr:glycosyltransferase family 4 protein [Hyphomicrobiales bacterium]